MERTNLGSLKQTDWFHSLVTETTLACFHLRSVHTQNPWGHFQESLATNGVSITANLDEKNPKPTKQKSHQKNPLKSLDNMNNKNCPFLNSNTTQTFSSSKKMIPWISGMTHTCTTSCHFCIEAEPYFSREQTWVKFSYT